MYAGCMGKISHTILKILNTFKSIQEYIGAHHCMDRAGKTADVIDEPVVCELQTAAESIHALYSRPPSSGLRV
jgi:hypothetical protein